MTRRSPKRRRPADAAPARSRPTGSRLLAGLARGAPPKARKPYRLLFVSGFLLLAVLVVFAQTINHDFVNFDDDGYVNENPHVRDGLTAEGMAWAFTAFCSDNWHPLTWLSHMLDCQFYGLKPAGHHLTNLLLHAATAVLLFLALRRMTAALWPSAWAATLFAIHPLRVESVAWVAERKDVLSGLFFMLTLWFYTCYAQRPAWGRYWFVVASFALGLTAKPMLVTLPFVLLLLDYWPLRRQGAGGHAEGTRQGAGGRRTEGDEPQISDLKSEVSNFKSEIQDRRSLQSPRLIVEKVPLFVLAAASCAVTLVAQRSAMAATDLDLPWRLANAAMAYVAYLGQMLCPAGLAVLYPIRDERPPGWAVVGAVALLVVVSMAVFAARRKCPYLLIGWLWYLGTLLPVIGLVQVGIQAMADRYTYLTQIGLYMALAWAGAEVAGRGPYRRCCCAAAAALLAACLMVSAWQQASYWQNSERLWNRTLACTSSNPLAHLDLGLALAAAGRYEEAIPHYQQALQARPDSLEAHYELGRALTLLGRFEEAIEHYRRAVEIDANYADAHINLGLALAGRGQFNEAIAQYETALQINPDNPRAHNNLGFLLTNLGQTGKAIAHYRQALELKPDYALAHNNLGNALDGQGQAEEAIAHYRQALKAKPDYAEAHNNLANRLVGRGQFDEAIAHFRAALAIAPHVAAIHYNLADALAEGGRADEAIAQYRQALETQPDYVEAHHNLGLALAGRGHVDEAIAHYLKALQIRPDYAKAHASLGDALAGRGKLDEAIAHYQKALALASAQNNKNLVDLVRARILLHQPSKPLKSAPHPRP